MERLGFKARLYLLILYTLASPTGFILLVALEGIDGLGLSVITSSLLLSSLISVCVLERAVEQLEETS